MQFPRLDCFSVSLPPPSAGSCHSNNITPPLQTGLSPHPVSSHRFIPAPLFRILSFECALLRLPFVAPCILRSAPPHLPPPSFAFQAHDTAVQAITWSHNNEFMVTGDKARTSTALHPSICFACIPFTLPFTLRFLLSVPPLFDTEDSPTPLRPFACWHTTPVMPFYSNAPTSTISTPAP